MIQSRGTHGRGRAARSALLGKQQPDQRWRRYFIDAYARERARYGLKPAPALGLGTPDAELAAIQREADANARQVSTDGRRTIPGIFLVPLSALVLWAAWKVIASQLGPDPRERAIAGIRRRMSGQD